MKSMHHLRAFLFLAVALLVSTSYLDAQNQYYASASGSGSACSIGSPCTPATAVSTFSLANPGGAVINFVPGNYGGAKLTINRGGNSDAQRLTLICTQQWSSPSSSGCIQLSFLVTSANYVTVGAINRFGFDYTNPNDETGVDVSWQCGTASTCSSGNGIKAIGNYLHDIGQNVRGGCPQAGAILAPTGHGHTITGFQAVGNVIDHYGINGGSTCAEAHGIYVASAGGLVQNNIITRAAASAIQYYDRACSSTISNNDLMTSRFGLIYFGGNGCTPGFNTGINNIIVNNSDSGIYTGVSGQSICSTNRPALFSNNIFFGNGTNYHLATAACETRGATLTEAPAATFVSYTGTATGNYHILGGSIAHGGGTSTGVSGGMTPFVPSNDIAGVSRPLSGTQDIGANVFSSAGVPIVGFSPSPLAFGGVAVSSSLTLNATLTNTGSANLTLTAAISGTNAGDFVLLSTTCANPLAGGASCTFSIRFTPSATGARSANLTLNDNASGSPHQLPLTGSGGSGVAALTPSPTAFPTTTPGSCSVAQSVTLSNSGSVSFTQNANSSITPNQADFQFSSPIGSCTNGALAPGASCTTSVKFCPSTAGPRSATFNAFTDANDPSVALTGTGGAPFVSLTPASFDFGSVQAGTASPAKSFTLVNNGNAPLVFTISTSSGVFAQGNTCTSPMPAASFCNISVTFQPSSGGIQNGFLSVASNATSSPNTSALTGNGTVPASLTLAPATVNFSNTLTGSLSDPVNITVTNPNAVAITISGISLIGVNAADFTVGTCPGSIAAGGTCALSVTFSPLTAGNKTAAVSIADSAAGSPHQATLNGLATAATMSLGPALTFGNQVVGTTSGTQNVTFSNSGNGPMTFMIALAGTNPGDFVLGATTCTSPIGGGQNCLVPVQFKPTTSGARSALVRFTDSASGSPHTVGVSGTGLAATPAVCPATTSFNFGNQPVNTSSGNQSIAITNCGTANLIVSSVSMTGNFAEGDSCTTVAPGAFCTINATFTPATAGTLSGSINITSNAASSVDHVALSGFGTQTGGTLLPAPLAFGSHTVGTTTNLTLTFTNTGNTSVTLPAPTIGGTNPSDFTPSSSCTTVAPGATCTISVSFVPGGAGSRTAVLSQLVGSTQMTINLSGTGVAAAPAVSLDQATLDFGNVQQSSASATKTVQLTNTGTAALTISSITPTGAAAADYTITTHCPGSVAGGSVCTIDAFCTPSGTGNRAGAITITDNASDSPQAVTLACNGTASPAPRVQPSPTALVFDSTQVGNTSGAKVTTITNNGNANLIFSTVGIGGTNTGDFQLDNGCPTGAPGLAPGLNCALTINFMPLAAGVRSAALIVTDSASDSPQSIPLSGTAFLGEGNLLIPISSVNFGNTTVGTTSAPVVFTLMNNGGATATIAVQISNEFIESDTCSGSIAASAFCSVTLTFAPQAACGQFNEDHTCASNIHLGQFVVTSNTVNSPQTVQLQGTAINQTPPPGPVIVGMGGAVGGGGQITAGVH